jgi:hypothetical protein
VSFFLRLSSVLKYSPDQPRDEHGRWTTGEGLTFVPPNTGHLDIRTAFHALSSQRHEAMVVAGRDIDTSLGVHSETHSGIGAWKNGAEDTTISIVHGATWNKIRAIAAMKGYIAEQKAVLAFQKTEKGTDFLANFHTEGSLEEIYQKLINLGVENHTLVPERPAVWEARVVY